MNDLHNILGEINAKSFHPIYCLMGDEAFFIDRIEQHLRKHVLEPHEQDFNLHILYGKDCKVQDVLAQARQYPVMAARQLVIIREAQHLVTAMDELIPYAGEPVRTTVLALCIKGKKLKGNSRLVKALKSGGACIFEARQLRDYEWLKWVQGYLADIGRKAEPKAVQLLLESVGGTDLSRLAHSIDKLDEVVPTGETITAAHVDRYTGISREYNYFEFKKALGERNYPKLIAIARYLSDPSRKGESPILLGTMIQFLSQVLRYHSLSHLRDPRKIEAEFGGSSFIVKECRAAAANYSMKELTQIISLLRQLDARSKGVGADHYGQSDLIRELIGALV